MSPRMCTLQLASLCLVTGIMASGCKGSSAYDGTYQVELKLKDWDCGDSNFAPYPDNYEETGMAVFSVYHTAKDTVVFDIGTMILSGPQTGPTFAVEYNYSSEDQACGTETIERAATLEGNFSKDLGISGSWETTDEVQRSGCKGTADYELNCTEEWELAGYRINNTPGMDPRDPESSANWGYTPGWSY